jgi:hypothetical protein
MGLTDKLEKSAIIDLVTVVVLTYDLYLLYNSLGWNKEDVFGVSGDPTIIAVQITGILVLIYGIEFGIDKFKGGGDDLSIG